MKKNLFAEAVFKFFLGVLLVGVLIFLPAGDFLWWRGWVLMGILFVPMFGAGLVMLKKTPDLLKSRLQAKETQKEQDMVVKLSGLMFLEAELPGYKEYKQKVKYRLIPGIW